MDATNPKIKNQNTGLSFIKNLLYFLVSCILFPIVNVIWALIEGLIFLVFRAMSTLLLMTVFVISFLFITNSVFLAGIPLFLTSCFLYYVLFEIEFFKNVESCQLNERKINCFELNKFQYTIHGCLIDKQWKCLSFLYEFLMGNVIKLQNKISSIGIDKSRNDQTQLPMFIKVLRCIFNSLPLLIYSVIHFPVGLIICISRATWRPLLCVFGIVAVIQAGSVVASIILSLAVAVLFLGGCLLLDKTKEHIRFVSDFLEIPRIKNYLTNVTILLLDNILIYINSKYMRMGKKISEEGKENEKKSQKINVTTIEFSPQKLNLSDKQIILLDDDENNPQNILPPAQINLNEKTNL